VVVYLSVANDQPVSFFVVDGLLSTFHVDDGEPGLSNCHVIVQVYTQVIGPAVSHLVEHSSEKGLVRTTDHPRDAADVASLSFEDKGAYLFNRHPC